ncbi:6432_t:CDS:2, partial [Funneliformis geosporum]
PNSLDYFADNINKLPRLLRIDLGKRLLAFSNSLRVYKQSLWLFLSGVWFC